MRSASRPLDCAMPTVHFTSHLQQFMDCPVVEVAGNTVRIVLDRVFALNPKLRSYILDDQSGLRQHVNIFLDGQLIVDRTGLGDPVCESSEIYVLQALSGG